MDGGFPGAGPRGSQREVDTTKFYKLLEVDKNASEAEIRKAYKKLALKHHPDRKGDPEKFKELGRAYEVLSDPDKRQMYDRFGEKGINGDAAGGDPTDIFDTIFRPGRGDGKKRRPKTKDVVQPLKVSLEQLYQGTTKKMAINRKVIDKQSGVQSCSDCEGRGVKVQVVSM